MSLIAAKLGSCCWHRPGVPHRASISWGALNCFLWGHPGLWGGRWDSTISHLSNPVPTSKNSDKWSDKRQYWITYWCRESLPSIEFTQISVLQLPWLSSICRNQYVAPLNSNSANSWQSLLGILYRGRLYIWTGATLSRVRDCCAPFCALLLSYVSTKRTVLVIWRSHGLCYWRSQTEQCYRFPLMIAEELARRSPPYVRAWFKERSSIHFPMRTKAPSTGNPPCR